MTTTQNSALNLVIALIADNDAFTVEHTDGAYYISHLSQVGMTNDKRGNRYFSEGVSVSFDDENLVIKVIEFNAFEAGRIVLVGTFARNHGLILGALETAFNTEF